MAHLQYPSDRISVPPSLLPWSKASLSHFYSNILLTCLPTKTPLSMSSSHSSYSDSFKIKVRWHYFFAQNSSFTLKAKVITIAYKTLQNFVPSPVSALDNFPACTLFSIHGHIPTFCSGCSLCLKFPCARCLHCCLPVADCYGCQTFFALKRRFLLPHWDVWLIWLMKCTVIYASPK